VITIGDGTVSYDTNPFKIEVTFDHGWSEHIEELDYKQAVKLHRYLGEALKDLSAKWAKGEEGSTDERQSRGKSKAIRHTMTPYPVFAGVSVSTADHQITESW